MNKKLTSVLALALCLIMVVGVFAACGPKEPEVVPATFKHHMDICGINKKYKLGLTNPSVDQVAEWISKI